MKKLFLISLLITAYAQVQTQCTHPDYDSLIDLFESADGQNWNFNKGWQEGKNGISCDPCNFEGEPWYGIKCENNRVISIDFNPNGLTTTNLLKGGIPDLQLSELKILDLSWNMLSGPIPDFSGVPKLDTLNLGTNTIDFPIPNFSGLPQLRYLDIFQSQLSGDIPDFSNLPQLEELILSLNNLTSIPNFSNLPLLEKIDIQSNRLLSGEVPDFNAIPKLQYLDMSSCLLSGSIPNFSNVPDLRHLDLSRNELTAYPDFSQIPLLEYLDLVANEIVGPVHPFASLPLLQFLDLRFNELSGDMPRYNDKPQLIEIRINGENITGELPGLQSSVLLEKIDIDQTSISGAIPSFDWMPNLEFISLRSNQLVGSFPDFKNPLLVRIEVDNNNLTGPIPELSEVLDISNINCSFNDLEGCYPSYICQIFFNAGSNYKLPWYGFNFSNACNDIDQTDAPCSTNGSTNSFEIINEDCECGDFECVNTHPDFDMLMKIYDETGGENWTNQEGWDRAKAKALCDPCRIDQPMYGVTCENGRVSCIDFNGGANVCDPLGIGGNNLVGELPFLRFDSLKALRLNNNELTGLLPDINGMPRLETLSLAFNNYNGSIPETLLNSSLTTLRISSNELTGTIPDVLASSNLDVFTAAFNDLEGCYPDSICNLFLVDFANNPKLPFDGNVDLFCMGEDQIGAPCQSEISSNTISENCECIEFVSATDDVNISQLKIYPNPSYNFVHFSRPLVNTQYQLFDNLGHLLLSGRSDQLEHLDISTLPSGIYFLKLTDNEADSHSYKILKME